jgi:hypothetical protein
MSGFPGHNFEAFDNAAKDLRTLGFIVISPADNFGREVHYPREVYMRADIQHVLQADVLVMLSGWQSSKGAKAEVLVAIECGIPVIRHSDMSPIRITRAEAEIKVAYPMEPSL